MANIYSLMQPGQRITSSSFLKNDKTKKNKVSLSDIRMASIRDFDTVTTPMSSTFMEMGSEVRDGVLSAYAQYGSAMKFDPALRSTVDLAMALVMNQPYDKVAKNHDAYVRIFAGQDLDDKSLGEAMVDAWNSDQVATDIANLQRRKDASEDAAEIARLEEQIQAKERDAVRLGDYTERAGIRGWFGNQLVKTMQIAPQVIEGATQSMFYALAFAGLSAMLTPAGATTVLGGSAGITGASSMLNYLRMLASTSQGAGQIGSAAGTASYLAQTVFPREYGTMSRQLEQFRDSNDMHMDKEIRKKASTIYALASTAIEFMTPEPGFGKMLMGIAPESLLQNSFKGWLKRVGVNMLEGAASESIEEALQDFVGSFVQDVAAIASDKKGKTSYNIGSLVDNMPKYFTQAGKTLLDTFIPSLLVGAPGAITSANAASYLTDYRNMRDVAYRAATQEARNNALLTQNTNKRTVIVPADIIDFRPGSINEFASRIESSTQEESAKEPKKFDPIKVRFDRERGRYVPVDDYNYDLAKYLFVNLKNDAIAVDIINDGAVRMSSDDIRNAAEISGGAMRDGSDLVFRNQEDAYRFAQSINDSSVMYRDADGQLTLEFTDTEGNQQLTPVTIDEAADIESMAGSYAQQTITQDAAQDTGNQTSVQEMADAIRTASRKHISENASMALARLFDMLPGNVRDTIFSRNNGRLVITDSEYERITGRKLNTESRAAAWLNRLQMVFTGKSDASSFVHEMGHIALIANPELAEGVRLAFAVNLDTEEGLNTFLKFIDENKDIIRVKSREEAMGLLREIGNIEGGNVFTDSAEELLMSMLEAHFRTDLRGENLTVLPQQVRDIFQRIANSIRRIYGRATGRTTLPRDVQDAFNSFFWNGESLSAEERSDILNQRGLEDESTTAVREGQADRRGDGLSSDRRQTGENQQPYVGSGLAQGLSGDTRLSQGNDLRTDRDGVRLESILRKKKYSYHYLPIRQITNNDAQRFYNALANVQKTNPRGLYVSLYGVEEYADPSIRLFMSEDESVGFAIKSDGDIVSVFSDKTKANHPGAVYSVLLTAIENGGTKLDCYGGDLLKVYMRMGFVPQGKVAYNEEYESAEWTARKDILGSPDVYALYYGDSSIDETLSRLEQRFSEINDDTIESVIDNLQEYTDAEINGEAVYGYDQLMAERDDSLANLSRYTDDIRSQPVLGESAVEQGQKKFMRMADDRFTRSIEKDIFLPEYVVKAKLGSENQSVAELARRELDDRDKFALLSPVEVSALYDTDSADEYVSRMKSEGSLSLTDEAQTERVYRKAWAYAHTMTPKEAVNSFKERFNTLPRLMELKRILGPRRIQAKGSDGRTYTRMYVPKNNPVYQKLARLSADSPISEVNEVLSSMDSNPRAWLHAYQDAVNSGARIEGTLSADQDIIDSYVDMADADFDIIKNELRRGEEPYGVSYETVYGVSDADIVNLSVEEAERQSREAGNTTEEEASDATPSENAKKLQKSLKIASTAASRAQDRVRTLETQMDSLRQKHHASEERMHENIQVLRKVARSKSKEVEDLRAKLGNALTRENDTRHEYAEKLKKTERELRTANNEVKRAEKRLEDSRASFERRMEDMRGKVSAARQEAHSQTVRANKLDRLLKAMATRTQSERITRAIKGRLSINSKVHDRAMLEQPLYYIYYLMHNGQNRRYSQYQSTENMPDFDYQMETLRGGLSEGLQEMDADGNPIPVTINLGHEDANGNPVIAYSGNLAAYRYDRKKIPESLKKHLSADTISALEADGELRWSGLTVGQKRDIYDALVILKQEAADSRSEVVDAQMFSRRNLAREAARTVMGSSITEITDEMRDATKRRMQSIDPDYNGAPTDEEVWDFISKHPEQYINSIKPDRKKNLMDSYSLNFYKMQRIARILDGGKEDGPFQRIFVRNFQTAYDESMRNIDRRIGEFRSALEGIIGSSGSKEYRNAMESLRKDAIHLDTRAILGSGVDANLMEAMAIYIYSQNINGATKLLSSDGNNLSFEDLARINAKAALRYIDLELAMRSDAGRDADHPTPFPLEKAEDLEKLKRRIESGEFEESIVPEWVRNIGDMMIDQLAKETPRVADAAYSEYNILLEIQERYFPLAQASRGSWGDILLGNKKRGVASVDSGALKVRQKNARYPLMLDPFSVFLSAIREQENLISMTKPVADASYLLKFGNVGAVVSNRYGAKWSKALEDYVMRIANPENKLTDIEKLMNRVLGNAAAAKIGLNLMTGVKQFVSLIPAAVDGELSGSDIINGISHVLSPKNREETRELMDKAAYSVVRSGYDVDISRLRGMADMTRFGELNQRFIDISTWLTQRGDELSKMIVWTAMYDKEIRNGASEADAAYAATDLVNRTLSVTSPLALSQAQSSRNPLLRAFFMFTNDLFQMWNIIFADMRIDIRNGDYAKAFSRFGGAAATAAVLALLAGGWLPDQDDDDELFKADDFLWDFMENLLGYSIPLGGQLTSDWMRGYSQSIITFPDEIISTARMVYKGLRDEKDYTADEYFDQVMDLLLSGGELAGVPATGLKRPVQSIYDSESGEFRLNPAYLFGTRWGRGMPNLLSELVN